MAEFMLLISELRLSRVWLSFPVMFNILLILATSPESSQRASLNSIHPQKHSSTHTQEQSDWLKTQTHDYLMQSQFYALALYTQLHISTEL